MFIELLGKSIPVYGLLIVLGVVVANLFAVVYLKKIQYDLNNFIVLEAYCFLGAIVGAKVLYLVVSYDLIQWNRILELDYLNSIMKGGFVFYGGMIGGLLFVLAAGKIHKIDAMPYIERLICLIPLIHAFGRIGCYRVGCCYGKHYEGFGAVVYGADTLAPHGVSLFPVQLVEAILLLVIFLCLVVLLLKGKEKFSISTYFVLYGLVRFALEYWRGDEDRKIYGFFSTSQWISLALISIGMLMFFTNGRRIKKVRE